MEEVGKLFYILMGVSSVINAGLSADAIIQGLAINAVLHITICISTLLVTIYGLFDYFNERLFEELRKHSV